MNMKTAAKNKKTAVYNKIKREIIQGTMAPGFPINENDLAKSLNVSKTPVREALRQLEREGLVETTHGRGSAVSHITFQDIREIFETREIIECGVARRAASSCNPDEVRAKKKELQELPFETGNIAESVWGPEEDIHLYIIRNLKNQKLLDTYLGLLDHIKRIRINFGRRFVPHRMSEIRNEHIAILDALIEGDADIAEQQVQMHLRNAAAYLMGLSSPKKG